MNLDQTCQPLRIQSCNLYSQNLYFSLKTCIFQIRGGCVGGTPAKRSWVHLLDLKVYNGPKSSYLLTIFNNFFMKTALLFTDRPIINTFLWHQCLPSLHLRTKRPTGKHQSTTWAEARMFLWTGAPICLLMYRYNGALQGSKGVQCTGKNCHLYIILKKYNFVSNEVKIIICAGIIFFEGYIQQCFFNVYLDPSKIIMPAQIIILTSLDTKL